MSTPPVRILPGLAALTAVAALAGACGGASSPASSSTTSSSTTSATTATTNTTKTGQGKVDVLYAGSLVALMEHKVGPAFDSATGYTFRGFAGGSTGLAKEIRGKVRQGGVFVSASPKADQALMGSANGSWVSWYATFAKSPLVLGYNPKSRFAVQLRSKPWYQVVTEPGFRLGRTDPTLDPKGKLIVKALDQAAGAHHAPALRKLATTTTGVYPEASLVGRLQAGQLDAGFFYSVEASAAHIPTVPLPGVHLGATYTVTVLRGAPDQAGAVSFAKFLLGTKGSGLLRAAGLDPVAPVVTGPASAVPAGLRSAL
ncbi:MAG: extracellular solute-binding protein, partial [Actinomycetes bacterium]